MPKHVIKHRLMKQQFFCQRYIVNNLHGYWGLRQVFKNVYFYKRFLLIFSLKKVYKRFMFRRASLHLGHSFVYI